MSKSLQLSQSREENLRLYGIWLKDAKDAAASKDPKAKEMLEVAGGAAGWLFEVYLGERGNLMDDMSEIERLLDTLGASTG